MPAAIPHNRADRGAVRVLFERAPARAFRLHPAALLHDVRELVRDERIAEHRVRAVLARRERDVAADREGARGELRGRGAGARVGVDAHIAEVEAEGVLHAAADRAVERRAATEVRASVQQVFAGRFRTPGAFEEEAADPAGEHAQDSAATAHRVRGQLLRYAAHVAGLGPARDALGDAPRDERDVRLCARRARRIDVAADGLLDARGGHRAIARERALDERASFRRASHARELRVRGNASGALQLVEEFRLAHLARRGLRVIVDDVRCRDRVGRAIRFHFGSVTRSVDGLTLQPESGLLLLDGVRQLVREEVPSGLRRRRVLAAAEDHVRADRVRKRAGIARGFGGARIGVNADVAEVTAEARFHVEAGGGIEGPARLRHRRRGRSGFLHGVSFRIARAASVPTVRGPSIAPAP
jgi:hypothetical protein